MQRVAFKQVDVFTAQAYAGNPVAVVLDASSLDAAAMQKIARWTNLSETAFVLPATTPDADYRLRIFTPRQELPFAGHPSVGAAHAVLEAALVPADSVRLVQECGAGLLPLRIERGDQRRHVFVRSPAAQFHPLVANDAELLAPALGAKPLLSPPPQVVSNGPHWWLAQMSDEATLRGLTPDYSRLSELTLARDTVGLALFARSESAEFDWVVRCFCPADGIPEDPVTGSANACIAAFLRQHKQLTNPSYRASQGREMGRDGQVELRAEGDQVWVGGESMTIIDGLISLNR